MSTKPPGRKRDALTQGVQDQIVALIERWKPDWGDLNASALERKVAGCLKISCTRQGLLKKDAIREAFEKRSQELKSGKAPKEKGADVVVLQRRIDSLEKELEARTKKVDELQEVVVRFRHHAKAMGIPPERFEAPIAPLVGGQAKVS